MKRVALVCSLLALAAVVSVAVEPSVSTDQSAGSTPAALPSLTDLEAREQKAPPGPDYLARQSEMNAHVIRLVETGALKTADDFCRAGKLIQAAGQGFRNARVGYELMLTAAALNDVEARKLLVSKWDDLMHSVGRPFRVDMYELTPKNPESFELDPAPSCIQTVLRDPEAARAKAKATPANAEVKEIVDADQADRKMDWNTLSADELAALRQRDRDRNKRMRAIMAEGNLHTASDFDRAALVMQHSAKFEGYQLAHELAVCALMVGENREGRWIAAASYDRMLRSLGHDQRFGTQYVTIQGTTVIQPVDTTGICDAERLALRCPTLEEARNRDWKALRAKAKKGE
jgi:hypothetical protein